MRRAFGSMGIPAAALLLIVAVTRPGWADSGVRVDQAGRSVTVIWSISDDEHGEAVFDLAPGRPIVRSLGVGTADRMATVATGLDPVASLTVGSRDLKNPAGWVAFFDNPPRRPHQTFPVTVGPRRATVTTEGSRTTVRLAEVSAGRFEGDLRFTFTRNSPLVLAEMVVSTREDGRAIVYDSGFAGTHPGWSAVAWDDTSGTIRRAKVDPAAPITPLAVSGRAIVAESEAGSLAVFPPPHRYFYPQDEAFNLKFVEHGSGFGGDEGAYRIGIRQSLTGDKRFVPWFNAPPGTDQHLGVFLLLARGDGRVALDAVAKYTHGDRYPKLPGHRTFTSHYHVEHSLEYLRKQQEQNTSGVPAGLETPGMVTTFKARGVDIVHLAEFHRGDTPKLAAPERLAQLKVMHDECARLSDEDLLILPGEEANVHLGGHWLSFFPRPVDWILNRKPGEPFAETVEGARHGLPRR